MQKNENEKSRNEEYKLPAILAHGIVFKEMAKAERSGQYKSKYNRRMYKIMNKLLGDDKKVTATYNNWFKDPEKYLNHALLESSIPNPELWLKRTSVMRFAIEQVLAEAVHTARTMKVFFEKEDERFSPLLSQFLTPQNQENEKS